MLLSNEVKDDVQDTNGKDDNVDSFNNPVFVLGDTGKPPGLSCKDIDRDDKHDHIPKD